MKQEAGHASQSLARLMDLHFGIHRPCLEFGPTHVTGAGDRLHMGDIKKQSCVCLLYSVEK